MSTLAYIANVRLPTEKAHGLQIMKTCEALAEAGAAVTLLVPRRRNKITDDPFAYYDVKNNFTIVRMPSIDTVGWGRVGFLLQSLFFGLAVRTYLRIHPYDWVYSRDEVPLYVARARGKQAWESHEGRYNWLIKRLLRRVQRIVVISEGLADFYRARGVSREKLVVARDAVDLAAFAHPIEQAAARARLGLPLDKKIALYIGRLDGYKGAETYFRAAEYFDTDMLAVVIGGEPGQVERLATQYPRVRFLGYRPYRELADNQAAADVLVVPNSRESTVSAHYTSPLKLFTYMASGRPVVASDLPSIREVLDERAAYFVQPDNPADLAAGIKEALANPSEAVAKAREAQDRVKAYTWTARAAVITRALGIGLP